MADFHYLQGLKSACLRSLLYSFNHSVSSHPIFKRWTQASVISKILSQTAVGSGYVVDHGRNTAGGWIIFFWNNYRLQCLILFCCKSHCFAVICPGQVVSSGGHWIVKPRAAQLDIQ